MFFVLQMSLVTKINVKDLLLVNLTCCSHSVKIVSNIKNKLTPRQIHMFRKTLFGHFLDIKPVFNGPLCHYILLRRGDDGQDNIISFKLLG